MLGVVASSAPFEVGCSIVGSLFVLVVDIGVLWAWLLQKCLGNESMCQLRDLLPVPNKPYVQVAIVRECPAQVLSSCLVPKASSCRGFVTWKGRHFLPLLKL